MCANHRLSQAEEPQKRGRAQHQRRSFTYIQRCWDRRGYGTSFRLFDNLGVSELASSSDDMSIKNDQSTLRFSTRFDCIVFLGRKHTESAHKKRLTKKKKKKSAPGIRTVKFLASPERLSRSAPVLTPSVIFLHTRWRTLRTSTRKKPTGG